MLAGHAPVHIGIQVVSANAQTAPNQDGWKVPGLYEPADGTGRESQVLGDFINSQQQRIRHARTPFDDLLPCLG